MMLKCLYAHINAASSVDLNTRLKTKTSRQLKNYENILIIYSLQKHTFVEGHQRSLKSEIDFDQVFSEEHDLSNTEPVGKFFCKSIMKTCIFVEPKETSYQVSMNFVW